jgi:hypothetical protein
MPMKMNSNASLHGRDTCEKERTHSPTNEHKDSDKRDMRRRDVYSRTFCGIRGVMIWI